MLNFQIRLFKRFDGGWGKMDENGKWNGLLSNLQNGEADVGVILLNLCCRRTDVVDFLWSTDHPFEVFAIRSQQYNNNRIPIFLHAKNKTLNMIAIY